MKNKNLSILKKGVKYLRELSIVITGIAITFLVSDCINSQKEKTELNRYLEAVRLELEENSILLKEKTEFYEHSAKLAHYLSSDKKENLNMDSIDRINKQQEYQVTSYFFTLTYQRSAFDMLKESGSIYMIKNKSLLKSILDSYLQLEMVKKESDSYMTRKMDIVLRDLLENERANIDLLDPNFKLLFNFFAIHIDLESIFNECSRQFEETLSLF